MRNANFICRRGVALGRWAASFTAMARTLSRLATCSGVMRLGSAGGNRASRDYGLPPGTSARMGGMLENWVMPAFMLIWLVAAAVWYRQYGREHSAWRRRIALIG